MRLTVLMLNLSTGLSLPLNNISANSIRKASQYEAKNNEDPAGRFKKIRTVKSYLYFQHPTAPDIYALYTYNLSKSRLCRILKHDSHTIQRLERILTCMGQCLLQEIARAT